MIFINDIKVESTTFPDGTSSVRLENNKLKMINIITWLYDNDAEMMQLFYLVNHLKQYKTKLVLRMPYIPNARMDRVKKSSEIFTLKYFASFINSLGFDTVQVLDPHSNVATALLDNVIIEPVKAWIDMALMNLYNCKDYENKLVFCYPDEGAMKRYSDTYAPYCFGIKNRDWATGEILSLKLENGNIVKGKEVLIIDDICSKGTTFLNTAKALREAGAERVYLYITHCEDNIHNGELLESNYIDRIFTSPSIIRKVHPKITIIDSLTRPLIY